jgi:hypothetical protein
MSDKLQFVGGPSAQLDHAFDVQKVGGQASVE